MKPLLAICKLVIASLTATNDDEQDVCYEVLPICPGVEHTWTDEGLMGLKLRRRGDSSDSPGGVIVEDAAPFVPPAVVGLALYSIGGEDVSKCSYDDVLAKMTAASRPVQLQFIQPPAEPTVSWVCFVDRYGAPTPYNAEITAQIEAAYESKAEVTFSQTFDGHESNYRIDWPHMEQVNTDSNKYRKIQRIVDEPELPPMFPLLSAPKAGASRVPTKRAPQWLQQHLNGTAASSLWIRCAKSELIQGQDMQAYVPVDGGERRQKYYIPMFNSYKQDAALAESGGDCTVQRGSSVTVAEQIGVAQDQARRMLDAGIVEDPAPIPQLVPADDLPEKISRAVTESEGRRVLRHVPMAPGQQLRVGDRVEVTLDTEFVDDSCAKKAESLTEALDAIQNGNSAVLTGLRQVTALYCTVLTGLRQVTALI
jgi:hypothetical protein